MLGAAIIHPDVRAVIPLMPEPIVQQDGTSKNDCERTAAKRFVAQLRQDYPHLKCIITEDSLSSNAPHIETLHDHQLHYILGVKAGDHAWRFKQVEAADQAGRVTHYTRHDRSAGLVHRFRFVNQVPLNASNTDVHVNFIEYWEIQSAKVQHFSWVTDIRVSQRNVYRLMRGGRARWKIENETFNTLKNQGYHTAALLCLVSSGVGQAGEQTPAMGTDASVVLCLCPGVHAAAARSPLVRREEAHPSLCVRLLVSSRSLLYAH